MKLIDRLNVKEIKEILEKTSWEFETNGSSVDSPKAYEACEYLAGQRFSEKLIKETILLFEEEIEQRLVEDKYNGEEYEDYDLSYFICEFIADFIAAQRTGQFIINEDVTFYIYN